MKTFRSPTPSHPHGAGNRLARGIGTQVAAVLLALLVTPSAFAFHDTHAELAPPVARDATPDAPDAAAKP